MNNPNGQWVQIGRGTYQKYNPTLGIRTTVRMEESGVPGKINLHTKHEQYVGGIIELNKRQQNDFKGFKGDLMTQVARIPLVEHRKIMQRCGLERGQYDQKKFRQILNDPDYKYFKTIDKKL